MSQEKLGELVGKAQQTIQGYEKEENPSEPSVDMFERLAEHLKCTPCWLAFGIKFTATISSADMTFDRKLMEETIPKFERFMSTKKQASALLPEKRARMLLDICRVVEILKTTDNLEPVLERIFTAALKG
jgi:transcriptional regulator with XRE-family HTH domain